MTNIRRVDARLPIEASRPLRGVALPRPATGRERLVEEAPRLPSSRTVNVGRPLGRMNALWSGRGAASYPLSASLRLRGGNGVSGGGRVAGMEVDPDDYVNLSVFFKDAVARLSRGLKVIEGRIDSALTASSTAVRPPRRSPATQDMGKAIQDLLGLMHDKIIPAPSGVNELAWFRRVVLPLFESILSMTGRLYAARYGQEADGIVAVMDEVIQNVPPRFANSNVALSVSLASVKALAEAGKMEEARARFDSIQTALGRSAATNVEFLMAKYRLGMFESEEEGRVWRESMEDELARIGPYVVIARALVNKRYADAGDWYLTEGKFDEAVDAYHMAIKNSDATLAERQYATKAIKNALQKAAGLIDETNYRRVQGFLPRYVKEVDFFTAQGLFDEAYGMADEAIERIKKYEALLEKQGKKISNGLKTALMELNLSAADAAAIGGGRLTLALRELADIPEKSRFAHDHNVAERRFNLMMTEGYYESAVALAQRQKRGAKDIGERTNWDILEERAILHNRLKDLAKEISTGMADVRAVKSFIGKAREALKLKDSVSPEEVVNEMNFLERLGRLHEHPWLNNLIGGWEGFIARLERVIGTSARSNFPQGGGDRM